MSKKLKTLERRHADRRTFLGAICSVIAMLTGALIIGISLSALIPPHTISLVGAMVVTLICATALAGAGMALRDRSSVINIVIYGFTVGGLIAFLRIVRAIASQGQPLSWLAVGVGLFSLCLCLGGAALTKHRSLVQKTRRVRGAVKNDPAHLD